MKFLPLVWSAIMRKPIRSGVTFLSVAVAFALFGLMIGLNATLGYMRQKAHGDRIWSIPRFESTGIPISVARRIAAIPGIKKTSVMTYLGGYVGDPKNRVSPIFFDDRYADIFPDQVPLKEAAQLRTDRAAVIMNRTAAKLLNKRVGDRFTIVSPQTNRADDSKDWPLKVAAIFEDIPQFPGPMIAGNYDYYKESVSLPDQGKIGEVDSLVADEAEAARLAEYIDNLFANSGNPTRTQTETQIVAQGFGSINVPSLTRKIAAIGLFMIALLTANVLAQSVRERMAEFATLRAMGFSTLRLAGLVTAEGAIPCLAGALCGILVASWLAQQLSAVLPLGTGIPAPTMRAGVFLWALLSSLGLTVASTVLPVIGLARLHIATALSRYA